MTIFLYAHFKEGSMRIEPSSCIIKQAVCNNSLQHVENSAQIELVYEPLLFSRLLSNDSFPAVLTDGVGTVLFTGTVSVDTCWQDVGEPNPVDSISLTVNDYTQSLRIKTKEEIAIVDTSFKEAVTRLASQASIIVKGDVPHIPIPYFVIQKNRSVLSVLDALCFQYHHSFYFDNFGALQLFDFSLVPFNPDVLSADNILSPLRVKKSQKKYHAVTVGYATLTEKKNELVWRDAPQYGSNDQVQPITLQPGVYYPFESDPIIENDEGTVEQTFASGFAETKKKHNGELYFQRSKNTSLLYTSNHSVVQDWKGGIVVDRTDFSALGAALRVKNVGSTDAKLWQFAIRADAVYRNADAHITAGNSGKGEVYSIDTEFIFDSENAEKLARLLYRYSSFNNYTLDFNLDEKLLDQGSFTRINTGASGYECDVLITGVSFDAKKDVWSYKAVSISPADVVIKKQKQLASSESPLKGDKGEKGERGLQGLQGKEGKQGIPGAKGKDGKTSYFHIAYADTAVGGGFSQNPAGKKYVGTYTDFKKKDSANPKKYKWVKVKGDKGDPGQDGTTKFLTSLNVNGDYANQIGTYQGQLYRWVNGEWVLLNAVMPTNPVAYYDFEDKNSIITKTI